MAGALSDIQKLKENQERSMINCIERITEVEKLSEDYHTLKSRLEIISDKLRHDVMVPMGNVAFMPGYLTHTNEILVLLGDNWFAERTAKQAVGITARRIQSCQKMLNDLEKEKQQYSDWMKYVSEVQGNNDFVEIIEEYDPQKELSWNEQHRKNMKAHRDKSHADNLVEDPIMKLERLPLLEDISSERQVKSETDSSNDVTADISRTRLVKWQDEVDTNHMQINFSHTTALPPKNDQEQEDVKIQSPADIYKQFLPESQDAQPKSILKNKSNKQNASPVIAPELPSEEHNCLPSNTGLIQAFTGEIIERPVSQSSSTTSNEVSSRTTSRFKARKQNM